MEWLSTYEEQVRAKPWEQSDSDSGVSNSCVTQRGPLMLLNLFIIVCKVPAQKS